MALMMSSLYHALLAAGAGDESARDAAEEVAPYDSRFGKIEGELMLLKWMLGFNLAISIAVLAKLIA